MTEKAKSPPSISLAEYVRRVLAGFHGYPLASQAQRNESNTRIDGTTRGRPGRKRRPQLEADIAESSNVPVV